VNIKGPVSFKITLPESDEPIGRWLERHSVTIQISCQIGRYFVTMDWKKLLSFSDADGEHSENFSVTRTGSSLVETIQACAKATKLT
jgi:hypothetical protein